MDVEREYQRACCGDSYGYGCWTQCFPVNKNWPLAEGIERYIQWLMGVQPCRHKTHAHAKYRAEARRRATKEA